MFKYENLVPPPNGQTAEQIYGIFTRFEEMPGANFEPPMETIITTKGLWSDGLGELLTFFTSSTQWSGSKEYHYQVMFSASADCGDEEMFSVTYGHYAGSGSATAGGQSGDTATKAIYGQYRSMLLEAPPESGSAQGAEQLFVMEDGRNIEHFYAINFNRARFKDKLDPGNFQISLAKLSGSRTPNNVYTGSNVSVSASNEIITLIDDSGDANDSLGYPGISLPIRNLVSGTIDGGVYNPSNPHYYGLVYADNAIIVLDAAALNASSSFNTVTGSGVAGDNSYKLFTSISGSAVLGTGYGFTARSVEKKECAYYYVRVRPSSLNYSNNPTFVSGSLNTIKDVKFINDPNVYVTTIGLYNENRDLLAVAKMSKPIKKNFSSELSVTVKLEY